MLKVDQLFQLENHTKYSSCLTLYVDQGKAFETSIHSEKTPKIQTQFNCA